MTPATSITILRLALAPVFAVLAIYYSDSLKNESPQEWIRYTAIATYIIAALSDALDGYLARTYQQRTRLGAILDPIADKTLLLTGLITLTAVSWGQHDWRIPPWFTALVIVRDSIILGGIVVLYHLNGQVPIKPILAGKLCTLTQMIALGWVMLKPIPLSPLYPSIVAAIFTVWSGIAYIRVGISQLPSD